MRKGQTTLRTYPGPPDEAVAALTRDLKDDGWRPLTVTWIGPALVVVWEGTAGESTSEIVSGLAAFGAAALLAFAGMQLVGLQSVAGNTVAEMFYHGVGWLAFGLAALAVAVGLRK
ncbi:hypothetical protein BH23CHL8_BH23CHL8_18940 [soil metagenome]